MASLSLRKITKIYPHSGDDAKQAKKKKKGDEPEQKKVNLKITEQGVIAVQQEVLLGGNAQELLDNLQAEIAG